MSQLDSGFTGDSLKFIEKSDLDSEDLCRKESPNFCNKLLSRQGQEREETNTGSFGAFYYSKILQLSTTSALQCLHYNVTILAKTF